MKVILALLVLATVAVRAQILETAAVQAPAKPLIDGVIEDLWLEGRVQTQFRQTSPSINAHPTVLTEVYLMYDSHTLYVAVKAHQQQQTVRANQGRRDDAIIFQGDYLSIAIDPLRNGNAAYFFSVNPVNTLMDGLLDLLGNGDPKWDGTVTTATTITDSLWSVELELPLNTLIFQNAEVQDWGVQVLRHYAQNRETSIAQLVDHHQPLRVTNFIVVRGFSNLKKQHTFTAAPFVFTSSETNFLQHASALRFRGGLDLKFSPSPASLLLVTLYPDYAQVESDRELINISDLPTSYPEKRPFFLESSDLYPGLAVNTRNIQDIVAGLKYRSVSEMMKYDATAVLDGEHHLWFLGDWRWTDNEAFHVELIGGTKQQPSRSDYNVTTNVRTWFFDKQLTAYTWFGTINSRHRAGSEYESVNSVRWISRTLTIGLWNHIKSEFYNPNIVGHNTLSNETIVSGWVGYSWYSGEGFWRNIFVEVRGERYGLYSETRTEYHVLRASGRMIFQPHAGLGTWEVAGFYELPTRRFFRFRDATTTSGTPMHSDAIGRFHLIPKRSGAAAVQVKSDHSLPIGGTVTYKETHLRAARSQSIESEAYIKLTQHFILGYSLDVIKVGASTYQQQFQQQIHRARFAYNVTDRINVRAVFQLNTKEAAGEYSVTRPTTQLALSWEYDPGSFFYVVYTRNDMIEKLPQQLQAVPLVFSQAILVKLSKVLLF